MFCTNCGAKIDDRSKFCPDCGAPIARPAPAQQPAEAPEPLRADTPQSTEPPRTASPSDFTLRLEPEIPDALEPEAGPSLQLSDTASDAPARPPYRPQRRKGRSRLPILLLGVAAILAVIVILLVSGLFGSPKAKVGAALGKSFKAYEAVYDALGVRNTQRLLESRKYSQRLSLEVQDISDTLIGYSMDADLLKGFGVRMEQDVDAAARKQLLSAAVSYGSADLAEARLGAEDTILTLASSDFLGDTVYGLDTRTLGADLLRLDPTLPDELGSVSFDPFALAERYIKPFKVDPAATRAFIEAVEVKKNGSSTLSINGASQKCEKYAVTIPESALIDYLVAVGKAANVLSTRETAGELLRELGLPASAIDELLDELPETSSLDELTSSLRGMGKLELTLYTHSGYLAAVKYDEENLHIGLYLGGSDRYTDDLSFTLENAKGTLSLVSTGDHGSKGVFTDRTVLTVPDLKLTSELRYDPASGALSWSFDSADNTLFLDANGSYTADREGTVLNLDELRLKAYGETLLSVDLTLSIGAFRGAETGASEALLLGEMNESDFGRIRNDVTTNATAWIFRVIGQVPALTQMIF